MRRAALHTARLMTMTSLFVALPPIPAGARAGATWTAHADAVVTDPQLLQLLADRGLERTEQVGDRITVELLSSDIVATSAAVRTHGGTVTGLVGDQLVQADVPVGALGALTGAPATQLVRAPRRAGLLPATTLTAPADTAATTGTGTAGEVYDLAQLSAWHDTGITGAGIKVGVVDYFDMPAWNTSELGPVPSVANGRLFCQDTGGFDLCNGADIKSHDFDDHGLAIVEILKDAAPDAEIYIAEAGTLADLKAAIDWFAGKGVTVLNRSLHNGYDGPGDGTGPSDALVDYAASKGLTWFNSAGGLELPQYLRINVPTTLAANGYVDFDAGPLVDTWLRLDGSYLWFDGVRWSDWYSANATDYSIEFWAPKAGTGTALYYHHANPTSSQVLPLAAYNYGGYYYGPSKVDNSQIAGAPPLEADAMFVGTPNYYGADADGNGQGDGMIYMRMRRNTATPVGTAADVVEVSLGHGQLEYHQSEGSASDSFTDSRNGALVAVTTAWYTREISGISVWHGQTGVVGPTNDGRIKPDLAAPDRVFSVTYGAEIHGPDVSTPVAAGVGALIQQAGGGTPGEGTAALERYMVRDIYPDGRDNFTGDGAIVLSAVPSALGAAPVASYVPLSLPVRLFDSRPVPTGNGAGPFLPQAIFDLAVTGKAGVPASGVSAVAVNITVVNPMQRGYLQAFPTSRATVGATSTLNVSAAGINRPNFAIVPVGRGGSISLYVQMGGHVIVDLLGYFADSAAEGTASGRFVPLAEPERWMDTRGIGDSPLPAVFAGTARPVASNETIDVPRPATADTAIPETGVAALVVNLAGTNAAGSGYLRTFPAGATGATHSNVNLVPGGAAANLSIVPIGAGGSISVFTSQQTHEILDVVGYITDAAAATATLGMFQAISPVRAVDTRTPPPMPFAAGETRGYQLTGSFGVPSTAIGVAANLTVVSPTAQGYLTVFPTVQPATSNVNFIGGVTVANGALLSLSPTGGITALMSQSAHLLVDLNGYFLGGQPL